jgi:glutathione peroxidase
MAGAAQSQRTISSMTAANLYDFDVTRIDGQPVSLAQYRGQVMLIVNTASACGFTPQFAGLQTLHTT